MTIVLLLLAAVIALPGLAAAAHLGLVALGSLAWRPRLGRAARPTAGSTGSTGSTEPASSTPVRRHRFMVLIPAHDEELVLGATLAALQPELGPGDQVMVVADRCTDGTADIARQHGALVLERPAGSEAGRAAARQAGIDQVLEIETWDALVCIDADSIVDPGFLTACDAALADGAPALQARSEAAVGNGLVAQASLAAFALQGVTLPRGRDRLGLCVRLRGTGMVLRRDVAAKVNFRAAASEDLWCTADLVLAGIKPRHIETARLRSANVGNWRAYGTQRLRYEAGRVSAAREYLPALLRRPDRAQLELAWFLATPPFAVAVACLLAAAGLGALAGVGSFVVVCAAGLGVLAATLVIALVQARVGPRTWLALAVAPWYVPWKAALQVRAILTSRRRDAAYPPTARA